MIASRLGAQGAGHARLAALALAVGAVSRVTGRVFQGEGHGGSGRPE
jgi:hypothetical protein